MVDDLDRRFVAAAIRLGSGALGTTWPNPAVGAIVANRGTVLGRGRTGRGGRPHGETIALAQAGTGARGATLYVSLEPCAHFGKTPPCTNAIIAAGIARVVATGADPDSRVAGRGFAALEAAGIRVAGGVLAGLAERHQAGHLRRLSNGRPHVILKLAVSADDAIGRLGERVTVSGETALRHAQAFRSRVDAILVGRGTVGADDPALTCRLPGLASRSPVRVVLDTERRLDEDRTVFGGGAPTWVLHSGPDEATGPRRWLQAPRWAGGGLDLVACLARLAGEGITRLLVEGGAHLARAFLEADLVDEARLIRSPAVIGGEIVPALAGLPLSTIEASERFRRVERRALGGDLFSRYERVWA